jgi:hypothetical protein
VTRIAVIKHASGPVTRRAFEGSDFEEAQDAAVGWLARTMRPLDGDEMMICWPEFDVWPKSPADRAEYAA